MSFKFDREDHKAICLSPFTTIHMFPEIRLRDVPSRGINCLYRISLCCKHWWWWRWLDEENGWDLQRWEEEGFCFFLFFFVELKPGAVEVNGLQEGCQDSLWNDNWRWQRHPRSADHDRNGRQRGVGRKWMMGSIKTLFLIELMLSFIFFFHSGSEQIHFHSW